jgi:isoquinoline 1-oxidoreductase subunit alpha
VACGCVRLLCKFLNHGQLAGQNNFSDFLLTSGANSLQGEGMAITITINGAQRVLADDPATPLLWVLRDTLALTGTKYGCGAGLCGACTVHLDGKPVRSCITPISAVGSKQVTTIEGLSTNRSHPVQRAWIAEQVPQCGYCQSGQIMAAAALLASKPNPTDAEIDAAMAGNLCRCGTYPRIRRAIHRAAKGGA